MTEHLVPKIRDNLQMVLEKKGVLTWLPVWIYDFGMASL